MIENCRKDKQLWMDTLCRLQEKLIIANTDDCPSEEEEKGKRGQLTHRKSASTSPKASFSDFICSGKARGNPEEGCLLEINKDDYFIVCGYGRVINAREMHATGPREAQPEQTLLNKRQKFIKSYILKKQKARTFFLGRTVKVGPPIPPEDPCPLAIPEGIVYND
jgi:hypothetical protein